MQYLDKNSIVYFKKSSYLCTTKKKENLLKKFKIFRLVNKIVCV